MEPVIIIMMTIPGAYMFDTYENGSYIKAVANPNYALDAHDIR